MPTHPTDLTVRELTLRSPDSLIEVGSSVEADGPRGHHGQIVFTDSVPPGGRLVLHTGDGPLDAPVDASGLSSVRDVPARDARREFLSEQRAFTVLIGF